MKLKLHAIALLTISSCLITLPARSQQPLPAPAAPPPAPASVKPSYVGPSLSFGGGTTILGVDSRFPLSSIFSLRPSVRFPSGGVVIGSSVTYDFPSLGAELGLEPFAGVGFNVYTGDNNNSGTNFVGYVIGGADYSLSNEFTLTGNVNIPFQSGYSTNVALGVAYKF
jgi:hypothetical protein